jgi:hypothetical protein
VVGIGPGYAADDGRHLIGHEGQDAAAVAGGARELPGFSIVRATEESAAGCVAHVPEMVAPSGNLVFAAVVFATVGAADDGGGAGVVVAADEGGGAGAVVAPGAF